MVRQESIMKATEPPLPAHEHTSEMTAQQKVRSFELRGGTPGTPARQRWVATQKSDLYLWNRGA